MHPSIRTYLTVLWHPFLYEKIRWMSSPTMGGTLWYIITLWSKDCFCCSMCGDSLIHFIILLLGSSPRSRSVHQPHSCGRCGEDDLPRRMRTGISRGVFATRRQYVRSFFFHFRFHFHFHINFILCRALIGKVEEDMKNKVVSSEYTSSLRGLPLNSVVH